MVKVDAPFFTRLYVSYLALRCLPRYTWTARNWVLLTNYLLRGIIDWPTEEGQSRADIGPCDIQKLVDNIRKGE